MNGMSFRIPSGCYTLHNGSALLCKLADNYIFFLTKFQEKGLSLWLKINTKQITTQHLAISIICTRYKMLMNPLYWIINNTKRAHLGIMNIVLGLE